MPHDTPMTDMKLDAQEAKEATSPTTLSGAPEYPYGLRLDLNDESLDKLGMTDLPTVGSKKILYAMAEVVSISQNESQGGDARRSVGLQITQLSCKPAGDAAPKPKRSPSDALYGTPEANNLIPVQAVE